MSTRRRFIRDASAAAGTTLFLTPRGWAADPCAVHPNKPPLSLARLNQGAPARVGKMGTAFETWFKSKAICTDAGARGMVWNFFNPTENKGNWIYPMLSGKAMLWFMKRGELEQAKQLAESLLEWQQVRNDGPWARSYGAFPSMVEQKPNGFRAADYFYSGDNLVLIEALTLLYSHTQEERYLNSAIGAGTWITMVMSQGHRYGVLASDLGAPMYAVRGNGAFNNHIHANVEMMWIRALKRLGRVTGDAVYCTQAAKAEDFYRKGQSPTGAFYDHYESGFPPTPYATKNWKGYQPGQVISDNQLRCALGAVRMGEMDMARKFHQWLKPDAGAIPAYLDMQTGSSGFPTAKDTYFDVSSSGLYRSLCQWLGDAAGAKQCIQFLADHQSPNGGWYWGIVKHSDKPVKPEQAPVAGFWATADLSE